MWYRIAAEIVMVVHVVVVLAVLFGFLFSSLWLVYVGILVSVLMSDVVLGYCVLSRWEFVLRKKANPTIEYNYTWTSYYIHRLTGQRISDALYAKLSIAYLLIAILLTISVHTTLI